MIFLGAKSNGQGFKRSKLDCYQKSKPDCYPKDESFGYSMV